MNSLDDLLPAPDRSSWPAPLPTRMSPSSLTAFLVCPEAWRRKYLLGERGPSSGNLLIGRADSKACEADLGQKINTGVNLPLDTVRDIAAEAFDFELSEDGGPSEVEWDDGQTPGKARDMAVAVAAAYRDQVSEQIVPIAVEHHVELQLPNLPPMHGFVDVVESTRIRERKSANRKPGNNTPSPQHLTQTLLYTAATGLPTHFDYTVKKTHPEVVSALTEPTLVAHENIFRAGAQLELLLRTASQSILGLLDRLGPESHWPGTASAAAAASPCTYCSFNTDCRFVIR